MKELTVNNSVSRLNSDGRSKLMIPKGIYTIKRTIRKGVYLIWVGVEELTWLYASELDDMTPIGVSI